MPVEYEHLTVIQFFVAKETSMPELGLAGSAYYTTVNLLFRRVQIGAPFDETFLWQMHES